MGQPDLTIRVLVDRLLKGREFIMSMNLMRHYSHQLLVYEISESRPDCRHVQGKCAWFLSLEANVRFPSDC